MRRRSFIQTGLTALAAIPFVAKTTLSRAAEKCGEVPAASLIKDARKNIIKYVDKATPEAIKKAWPDKAEALLKKFEADKKKAGGETPNCENCVFYKQPQDGWGKCAMAAMQGVSNCGWCKQWNPKPS